MPKIRPLQEIILVNGTNFANKVCLEKNKKPLFNSFMEKNSRFNEDCSEVHLKLTLPELFSTIDSKANLYLWQMRDYDHMVVLEMSEEPMGLNIFKSIDPHVFMEGISNN